MVLNEKSQRCGECVRRGVKCDALQTSVDDLQSLRMEEDRLKFERDMAFEAAMAGLARVRELELRQAELRERGREMLRRGLKTLDELDEAEEKEKKESPNERREKKKRRKPGGQPCLPLLTTLISSLTSTLPSTLAGSGLLPNWQTWVLPVERRKLLRAAEQGLGFPCVF